MAALFHISTTDRLAAHDDGMRACATFANAQTVKDEAIAPAGRRRR